MTESVNVVIVIWVPKHFQYKLVFRWFITTKSCSQLKADIKWFGLGKLGVAIVHMYVRSPHVSMHTVFVYLEIYICICYICMPNIYPYLPFIYVHT